MADEQSKKLVLLLSSDGITVPISKKAVIRSFLIKGIIEDGNYKDGDEIKLEKVRGSTLKKIKEYLEHYENNQPFDIEHPLPSNKFEECVTEWDYNYTNIDVQEIFQLIRSSHYLDIRPLLYLCYAKLALMTKEKNNSIVNNFTEEEQEMILKAQQRYLKAH